MTKTKLEYDAELKELQEHLDAPFTEVNAKLESLAKQQAEAKQSLADLTEDDLTTVDGIAKQKTLRETLENVGLALERTKKQKYQIAKDKEPEARELLKAFRDMMKAAALAESDELFGKQIDSQLVALRSLVEQRKRYERNTEAEYEHLASDYCVNTYNATTSAFYPRLLFSRPKPSI